MMTRLNVPLQRECIRKEMEDLPVVTWENQWSGSSGITGVFLFSVLNKDLKKYEGKSLAEIGRLLNKDPRDVVIDFVIDYRRQIYCVNSGMREDNVWTTMRHPYISICIDSEAVAEDGPLSESKPHPCALGTFPRI